LAIDSIEKYDVRHLLLLVLLAEQVPTIRINESVVGKMPITLVRRSTSLCRRSIGFAECTRRRCSLEKCMWASTSSAATSSSSAAWGTLCSSILETSCSWVIALA
jgi:hypothetical protein